MLERLKALFEARVGFPFDPHVILLGYVGSIAHGTHTPSEDPASIDDVDLMGVVIPPPEMAIGAGASASRTVMAQACFPGGS